MAGTNRLCGSRTCRAITLDIVTFTVTAMHTDFCSHFQKQFAHTSARALAGRVCLFPARSLSATAHIASAHHSTFSLYNVDIFLSSSICFPNRRTVIAALTLYVANVAYPTQSTDEAHHCHSLRKTSGEFHLCHGAYSILVSFLVLLMSHSQLEHWNGSVIFDGEKSPYNWTRRNDSVCLCVCKRQLYERAKRCAPSKLWKICNSLGIAFQLSFACLPGLDGSHNHRVRLRFWPHVYVRVCGMSSYLGVCVCVYFIGFHFRSTCPHRKSTGTKIHLPDRFRIDHDGGGAFSHFILICVRAPYLPLKVLQLSHIGHGRAIYRLSFPSPSIITHIMSHTIFFPSCSSHLNVIRKFM